MSSDLLRRVKTVAQVQVDDLHRPSLREADRHHLVAVLRVRPGEILSLIDGRGGWALARWTAEAQVELESEVSYEAEPAPSKVAFALTKADKPDLVVQKLTELGVGFILPFVAERSVVRWDDDKRIKSVERFRRIAYEAAMQSRRLFVPTITEISSTRDIAAQGAVAAQFSGGCGNARFIAIGPEGGWSDAELEMFTETVDLGPTVLRSETAAVVAGVLVTSDHPASRHG